METTLDKLLNGRPIFHATPLHYLPLILEARELRCQTIVGYAMARPTARRRDCLLSVDQHVHFSLKQDSPLLRHKLGKGFPHAVLRFDTTSFARLSCSILPCSTKAWRSRWQCQPISGRVEMERILHDHDNCKKYPGLEILVKGQLSLTHLAEIVTFSEKDAELAGLLRSSVEAAKDVAISLSRNYDAIYRPINVDEIEEYFKVCAALKQALRPPNLPFD